MNRSHSSTEKHLHEDASLLALIKECCNHKDLSKGARIHAHILQKGSFFLANNVFIATALVTMYAKCGALPKARDLFDQHLSTFTRDLVAWTSLISGYSHHGFSEDALKCFDRMRNEGIHPDAFTFSCVLKACGSTDDVVKGRIIHEEIIEDGIALDTLLGSTLIDMYSKCGSMADAQQIFDTTHIKDSLKCTALITGYARQGNTELVFHMFEKMKKEGIKPDEITFLSVLNACSHGGLVKKGQEYYMTMIREHGLISTIKHHSCMVDRLGRAGQLDEAIRMIKEMPVDPNVVVWHSLLGACNTWGNVRLGRKVFETAHNLDTTDAASYVFMSNVYAC